MPQLEALLQDIPVSEDGDGEDCVPIFDRIDRAGVFIATDAHPDEEIASRLRFGAEYDLINNGMLKDNNYRGWMEVKEEAPAELPGDFQTDARPFRSIFDKEGF